MATYPEAVGELVLVGHSMGGLLIRSAGYYAEKATTSRQPAARKADEPATDGTGPAATETGSPNSAESPPPENEQPAAHSATSWLGRLRDVFLLGVPNDGSFLEQNSHLTSLVLRKINLWPTRAISGLLDQRSLYF